MNEHVRDIYTKHITAKYQKDLKNMSRFFVGASLDLQVDRQMDGQPETDGRIQATALCIIVYSTMSIAWIMALINYWTNYGPVHWCIYMRQYPGGVGRGGGGGCTTTVIWCCHKLLNQWQCSLQMKAALPLGNQLAITLGCINNTGPWQTSPTREAIAPVPLSTTNAPIGTMEGNQE